MSDATHLGFPELAVMPHPASRTADIQTLLASVGAGQRPRDYRGKESIVLQGDACHGLFYIQKGCVRLSVVNALGKEAVMAILGPGDFFGEGCLAGQDLHLRTATAITATSVLCIEREAMARALNTEPAISSRFIAYMLERNMRVEADLLDQLFNSAEKRLARALLLLARDNDQGHPPAGPAVLPKIPQETLAEMVGTTRSRVNLFMTKFKKLGFISYDGGLQVNNSLLHALREPGAARHRDRVARGTGADPFLLVDNTAPASKAKSRNIC